MVMAKILLVDDNLEERDFFKKCLTEDGHEVITAHSVREALGALKYTNGIEAVISDIHLVYLFDGTRDENALDGYDLATLAKLHYPQVRFLLQSGDPEYRKSPADIQMEKIWDKEMFQRVVRKLLK